jgi:hypothetical protein
VPHRESEPLRAFKAVSARPSVNMGMQLLRDYHDWRSPDRVVTGRSAQLVDWNRFLEEKCPSWDGDATRDIDRANILSPFALPSSFPVDRTCPHYLITSALDRQLPD